MVEFMQQGCTIMSEVYYETVKKLCMAIQAQNADVLCSASHGSVCPHTTAHTRAPLEHFDFELLSHPPYNPDLILGDYHLFTTLQQ